MDDRDIIEILSGNKEFTIVIDVRENLVVFKLQTDGKEYVTTLNGDEADYFKFFSLLLKKFSYQLRNKGTYSKPFVVVLSKVFVINLCNVAFNFIP